jgi:hypothetical protein
LPAVRLDLKRRGGRWLREAAATMAQATLADCKAWREVAGIAPDHACSLRALIASDIGAARTIA